MALSTEEMRRLGCVPMVAILLCVAALGGLFVFGCAEAPKPAPSPMIEEVIVPPEYDPPIAPPLDDETYEQHVSRCEWCQTCMERNTGMCEGGFEALKRDIKRHK